MDLMDRLEVLKSAWGLLSVGSVLFPGAAYWLNISSIKSSLFGEYYLLTAIPLGAIALLLTLIVTDILSDTAVRNLAVILAIAVVPTAIAGFVYFTVERQGSSSPEKGPEVCYVRAYGYTNGEGYVTFTYKIGGRIKVTKQPCECFQSRPMVYEDCRQTGQLETVLDIVNPAEYYALTLFNICIVTLTVTFTMLASYFD